MGVIQDFMNLILKNPNPTATRSAGPIQTEMKNAGYTQGNTVSKIGQNAANDVGGLAQFANDVINPLNPNNLLNVAVTHPSDLGSKVSQDVSSMGQGLNNMVGQPVNPKTGNLQIPDVGEAVTNAANHPVSTALAALGPKGLPKIGGDALKAAAPAEEASAPLTEAQAGRSNETNPTGASPVRIVMKPSVYGAGKESRVQSTIDAHVPGSTAAEVYANLEPTMDKFGQQINQSMQQSPKSATLDTLMQDYDKNLNSQGIYRTTKTPKDALQKEAAQYATDLLTSAANESSDVVPSSIPDYALYNARQAISQDAKSVYKKIENGTSLTDRDRVILAAGQSVDDTLSTLHPEVKDLITKQSHLYHAVDPVFDAREAEISSAAKAADKESNRNYSQQILGTKIPSRIAKPFVQKAESLANNAEDKVAGTSARLAPLGGSIMRGLPSIGGVQALANNISGEPENGPSNNESNHDQSVSQTYSDVNSGRYAALAPQGQLSTDQYTAQQNKYINDIASAKASGNTIAAQTLQGNLDSLNNSWNNASGVRDEAVKLNKTLLVGNAAARAIDAADPGLLSLNGSFDKLLNSSNRNYAALGSALQKLQQDTGVNISGAKTKEALVGALDQAMQVERTNYNALLQQQTGAPASQNKPAGIQALPTQAPQSNIGQPIHYDFNFGASGEHMPQ